MSIDIAMFVKEYLIMFIDLEGLSTRVTPFYELGFQTEQKGEIQMNTSIHLPVLPDYGYHITRGFCLPTLLLTQGNRLCL